MMSCLIKRKFIFAIIIVLVVFGFYIIKTNEESEVGYVTEYSKEKTMAISESLSENRNLAESTTPFVIYICRLDFASSFGASLYEMNNEGVLTFRFVKPFYPAYIYDAEMRKDLNDVMQVIFQKTIQLSASECEKINDYVSIIKENGIVDTSPDAGRVKIVHILIDNSYYGSDMLDGGSDELNSLVKILEDIFPMDAAIRFGSFLHNFVY